MKTHEWNIEVLKFGGSTFSSFKDFNRIACYLKKRLVQKETRLIVVVSAFSRLTERFRKFAHHVNSSPSPEAIDGLLPLADTVSASLLRMALEAEKVPTSMLMGFQLGIITNSNFSRARIQNLNDSFLLEVLCHVSVVVVPGGQAVDQDGRPTWLGKNSSDLAAVALTSMLGVKKCEIFSDVCGIFSADPYLLKNTRIIEQIPYDVVTAMALSGAKVMHYGAITMAKKNGIVILCRLNTEDFSSGSLIGRGQWPKAIVIDKRSLVLDFEKEFDRQRAQSLLTQIDVPVITAQHSGQEKLVVTCGFFDPITYLSHQGIKAKHEKGNLVSVFAENEKIERYIVAPHKILAFAQRKHDALYEDMKCVAVHLLPKNKILEMVSI